MSKNWLSVTCRTNLTRYIKNFWSHHTQKVELPMYLKCEKSDKSAIFLAIITGLEFGRVRLSKTTAIWEGRVQLLDNYYEGQVIFLGKISQFFSQLSDWTSGNLVQRSQLMVVRWSETTKNYVKPPEYSYPVVLWTTKISSPNQNCDMPQRYLNNCRHSRVIIPETLYPLSLFWRNKTRVRNHEGHELLTLRSIIIHAFCGFTKLTMW